MSNNALNGLGHGLLGLIGLGSVYDPLGDLRSQLASCTAEFNSMTAEYSYQAALLGHKELIWFEQLMKDEGAKARSHAQLVNQMIWDTLATENLFILMIYVLVFIVVASLILGNK